MNLSDLSNEDVRACIERQVCWCGAGPFRVLAQHTFKAHNIDRFELREMAGLVKTASVCGPDHHALMVEHGKQKGGVNAFPVEKRREIASRRGRHFSSAGIQSQRDKAAKITNEQRHAASLIGAAKRLTTHPCAICGATIEGSRPAACRGTCNTELRRRKQLARTDRDEALEVLRLGRLS